MSVVARLGITPPLITVTSRLGCLYIWLNPSIGSAVNHWKTGYEESGCGLVIIVSSTKSFCVLSCQSLFLVASLGDVWLHHLSRYRISHLASCFFLWTASIYRLLIVSLAPTIILPLLQCLSAAGVWDNPTNDPRSVIPNQSAVLTKQCTSRQWLAPPHACLSHTNIAYITVMLMLTITLLLGTVCSVNN